MPRQLCGYGRSDWSTKLIRGLTSEAAAGFRSRRGPNYDSTFVTPHNAPFATYKAARVHHGSRRRGGVAARGARAAAERCGAIGVADDCIAASDPEGRLVARRSARACRSSAGRRAGTSGSNTRWGCARHGVEATISRMSSVRAAARRHSCAATRLPLRRCCKQTAHDPHRFRERCLIRSAAGFVASLAAAGRQRHRLHQSRMLDRRGKWLELLKEIAPRADTGRGACSNPATAPHSDHYLDPFKAAARGLSPWRRSPAPVHDTMQSSKPPLRRNAREPNGGLIVMPRSLRQAPIARRLSRWLLATASPSGLSGSAIFAELGGLLSYGNDLTRAIIGVRPAYVDRILKGAKAGDLPVQAPAKFETGDQPQDRQGARPHRAAAASQRADEVIE